jgi:hypothetical protein
MRTEFDNLRLNKDHTVDSDSNGEKQTVKIYCLNLLIAKRIKLKKSIRYFAIKSYKDYLEYDT